MEKPKPQDAPSNLAIIGRYVLTPGIFETLSRTPLGTGGELQLTDGLKLLLAKEKIYGYVLEGKRHDTGDKLGFLKATVEFALKRPDLGEEFRAWLKELELCGIVIRRVLPGPPVGVEYELSPAGQDLGEAMDALGAWAQRWMETGQVASSPRRARV